MRAAFYDRLGPAAEVLTVGEQPTPEPGPGEVRVKLATSGVNPSDWKARLRWALRERAAGSDARELARAGAGFFCAKSGLARHVERAGDRTPMAEVWGVIVQYARRQVRRLGAHVHQAERALRRAAMAAHAGARSSTPANTRPRRGVLEASGLGAEAATPRQQTSSSWTKSGIPSSKPSCNTPVELRERRRPQLEHMKTITRSFSSSV